MDIRFFTYPVSHEELKLMLGCAGLILTHQLYANNSASLSHCQIQKRPDYGEYYHNNEPKHFLTASAKRTFYNICNGIDPQRYSNNSQY